VRFTQKPDALYAILLGTPPAAAVTLRDLRAAPGTALHLLGFDAPLAWQQTDDGVTVSFPRRRSKIPVRGRPRPWRSSSRRNLHLCPMTTPRQTPVGLSGGCRGCCSSTPMISGCTARSTKPSSGLKHGLVRSTTLMFPAPGHHRHPMGSGDSRYPLRRSSDVIRDTVNDEYGRSLPGRSASLLMRPVISISFERMAEFFRARRLDELETELRAQIEAVLAAGLKPTIWIGTALRLEGRTTSRRDARAGEEYGLALRVLGRHSIEQCSGRGCPSTTTISGQLQSRSWPANLARYVNCCVRYGGSERMGGPSRPG